ncbi:phosphotransferase [Streptomyces sp. LZ34]
MPAEGSDIIAHQDLAPWNLVVGDEDQWAFIDWDTAGPGSRLRDVAYAMHDFLRDQAARGNQPWAAWWAEGHRDAWRSDAEYIEQREDQWARALLDAATVAGRRWLATRCAHSLFIDVNGWVAAR